MKTSKYTVVGYFDDNGQVYNAHVNAVDECEAVTKAPAALGQKSDNVVVVSVFKGHLTDESESNTTSFASDWAGRTTLNGARRRR